MLPNGSHLDLPNELIIKSDPAGCNRLFCLSPSWQVDVPCCSPEVRRLCVPSCVVVVLQRLSSKATNRRMTLGMLCRWDKVLGCEVPCCAPLRCSQCTDSSDRLRNLTAMLGSAEMKVNIKYLGFGAGRESTRLCCEGRWVLSRSEMAGGCMVSPGQGQPRWLGGWSAGDLANRAPPRVLTGRTGSLYVWICMRNIISRDPWTRPDIQVTKRKLGTLHQNNIAVQGSGALVTAFKRHRVVSRDSSFIKMFALKQLQL